MIVFLILISVLFLVLIYLLFAPVSVEINSETMQARLRFHLVASVTLLFSGEPSLRLTVFGLSRVIGPGRPKAAPPEKKEEKKTGSKRHIDGRAMLRVLRSFRVKRWYIDVDPGDTQLSGILYPLFWWIEWKKGVHTRINFTGKNEVVLELSNNLARMARAYIGF